MGLMSLRRSGYEFSYSFSLVGGDEIIGSPSEVVFLLRTLFTLRDTHGEYQMLDAEEGMSVILPVTSDDPYDDFNHVCYRLDQYLMTEAEIQTLIQQALEFARPIVAVHPTDHPVIAIDINVCTVQLDGETVEEAIYRSVRPECLVPLDLIRPDVVAAKEDEAYLRLRDYLLYELPRIKVEDLHVDGFGPLMDTCPICSGGPTAAAPVSMLPCGHPFHTHCIVRWLLECESCPMCLHFAAARVKKEEEEEQLDWSIDQAQPTNHGPTVKKEDEQLDCPVTQAQPTSPPPAPARERRQRRAPAWQQDYVISGRGVSVRG